MITDEQEKVLKDARSLLAKHFTDFVIIIGPPTNGKVAFNGDISKLLPLVDQTADVFRHHICDPN